jgi:hypothetical protein
MGYAGTFIEAVLQEVSCDFSVLSAFGCLRNSLAKVVWRFPINWGHTKLRQHRCPTHADSVTLLLDPKADG